jgi:hypothetical protein
MIEFRRKVDKEMRISRASVRRYTTLAVDYHKTERSKVNFAGGVMVTVFIVLLRLARSGGFDHPAGQSRNHVIGVDAYGAKERI